MQEIWKDIPDYEKLYQVSTLGRIKSLYSNKILKPNIDKDGYYRYALCKNKKRKDYYGHRLVALTFIPNLYNYQQVNHIDGNKQNNCINNLEWCTCKENVIHSIEKLNKRKKEVSKYDMNNNYIETYNSIKIASEINDIKAQNIWRCCKNIRPTAGGYIWKYNNPTDRNNF